MTQDTTYAQIFIHCIHTCACAHTHTHNCVYTVHKNIISMLLLKDQFNMYIKYTHACIIHNKALKLTILYSYFMLYNFEYTKGKHTDIIIMFISFLYTA